MKKMICAAAAAAMFAFVPHSLAFDDISTSDKLNKITSELQALGIIDGYEDNTFNPNNTITRAEMTKIALKLLPETINPGISSYTVSENPLYSDVDMSHWAYSEIKKMSTMNIVNGYEDGTFRPDSPVTYQESLKIIIEMMNYSDDAAHFGGYPNGYIKTANELGITKDIQFNPADSTERGTVAVMIYNSLDIPCKVISSYIVGGNAEYVRDENITFRNTITNIN